MTGRLDGKRVCVSRPPWSKRQAEGVVGVATWVTSVTPIGDLPVSGNQYKVEPESEADQDKVADWVFAEDELDVL